MKKSIFACLMFVFVFNAASADIIEIGDLNIIDDPGNPSDGLRYLDMTFSNGLSLADALTNAQMTYSNARVATASEFDDLFAASSLVLDGAITPSDGFSTGLTATVSSGANYNAELRNVLGTTIVGANIWTLPDGSVDPGTTRDVFAIGTVAAAVRQSSGTPPVALPVGSSSRKFLSRVRLFAWQWVCLLLAQGVYDDETPRERTFPGLTLSRKFEPMTGRFFGV